VPLLAASKVPSVLPLLLTEKQDDGDIMVQLLYTLRCLLLQEETSEVVLQETDAPERILDVLEAEGQPSDQKTRAIQAAAEEVLDLILALEEQDDREPRWTQRIKAFRFEQHNQDWVQMLHRGDPHERHDRKSTTNENRSGMRWTDVGGLEDRCWGGPNGIALR